MSTQSRSQVVQSKPIGEELNGFWKTFKSICKNIGIPTSSQALKQVGYEVSSDNFDVERIRPLLDAVLEFQPDEVVLDRVHDTVTESTPLLHPASSFHQTPLFINTVSFANSTEYRKHVDNVLKGALEDIYVGIPGFVEAFFGDLPDLRPMAQAVFDECKEGDKPLFQVESDWQSWLEAAKENDVLSWFAPLTERLLGLADGSQPHQPLQGSTADRKLDIGFVDDPNAGMNSKCQWSHILVPGQLKSNPSADKASKA
ncbi:hypothetical protein COCSADRAFT_24544 [Bipolaris sorokiniana ND90Pr]|uniref:Uncharacterized protein n=1 Tax=Cochliobolus sativus (strain ND90Pr / ATCC 201652) TaxID=665912 RepID=M2TB35_COCSN|nr:uncharacterized protein COCSADRAFT_24544 [Bipolaris sorokiniana ND90Pr]EMD66431.1 hypothetical protein COCSADRAFT_24544 [Bipolaris sorokiniana ND90Pr]